MKTEDRLAAGLLLTAYGAWCLVVPDPDAHVIRIVTGGMAVYAAFFMAVCGR